MNKPKKVKAPEGCASYLTAGKEYEVLKIRGYTARKWYAFEIKDDSGDFIFSGEKHSAHLNGQDWIVTERESPQDDNYKQIVLTAYKDHELTQEDFEDTLAHYVELVKLEK